MKTDTRPSKFTQYRYLRWPWDNDLSQLAFLVNVDHDKDEIEFSVAICNKSDNFDFKTAHKLLNKRMTGKSKMYRFTISYDRDHTLMQNIFNFMFHESEMLLENIDLKRAVGKKITKAEQERASFLRLVVQHGLRISYRWLVHYNMQTKLRQIGLRLFVRFYYNIKHNWLHCPIPHVIYPEGIRDRLSPKEYKEIARGCYF